MLFFPLLGLIQSAVGQDYGFGREIEPYELDEISPLEEYVHRPDPHYRYERHSECEEQTATYKVFCFKVFSQKWLNESVWSSPVHENAVWWHWMVLVVPRKYSLDLGHKARGSKSLA